MIILDMEKPNSCAECELRFCGICEQGYDKEPCPIKAEIPDGITNGDVIKALFPNGAVAAMSYPFNKVGFITRDGNPDDNYVWYPTSWWNAPYGGMKNE